MKMIRGVVICALVILLNPLVTQAKTYGIVQNDTFFCHCTEEIKTITLVHKGETLDIINEGDTYLLVKLNGELGNVKTEDVLIGTTIEIPSNTGFKSWMPYNIFSTKTKQGQLQEIATTDENGFRLVDNRYCVAVGSGVSDTIGQYIDVILENGTIIPCIMGDQKADCHTQSNNIITVHNGCCVEFLVDKKILNTSVKRMGDCSYLKDEWNSPIKEMIIYHINK